MMLMNGAAAIVRDAYLPGRQGGISAYATMRRPSRRLEDSGDALPDGPGSDGGAGIEIQLGQDVADVSRRGAVADEERIGDLLVRAAVGDEPDDVEFARREAVSGV